LLYVVSVRDDLQYRSVEIKIRQTFPKRR